MDTIKIMSNKKLLELKNIHNKELRDKFKEGYNRGIEKGYKEGYEKGQKDGYHNGMTQERNGVHLSKNGIYVFDDKTTKQAINKHKLI